MKSFDSMKSFESRHVSITLIDNLSPEDGAMLQALYSRSATSVRDHVQKIDAEKSGAFMNKFYVGYGHKSIADGATTTLYIEGVSLLAAKAIQDWPLYAGQETSTRYIDFATQRIVSPCDSYAAKVIHARWMDFYHGSRPHVIDHLHAQYPRQPEEEEATYERAIGARAFDILRGFLPAGVTTNLSWHTNLRQAGDHLVGLRHHPLAEVRGIATGLQTVLAEQYPSSGAGMSLPSVSGERGDDTGTTLARRLWEQQVADRTTYQVEPFPVGEGKNIGIYQGILGECITDQLDPAVLQRFKYILQTRPRGCTLPPKLLAAGLLHFRFPLDFGSFRDLQRHRNGTCFMPLLTTKYGFHPWYIESLPPWLQDHATLLIKEQTRDLAKLAASDAERQYYCALGYRVPCHVVYGLPAALYVLELRAGKTVHPTLRKEILRLVDLFQNEFPDIALHADTDPDDWSVRRGRQTIEEKAP